MKIKTLLYLCLIAVVVASCAGKAGVSREKGWVKLFDGKSFNGWKINEHPETFKIEDGAIVVNGVRSHMFYEGAVANHDFKNFELKVTLMTTPGSNSGIFIQTAYQDSGWPAKGFEIQVNQTQTDWRKTGSVYGIKDVREVFVKDNEWYVEHIIVKDKTITVKVNDKVINEYTQPDDYVPTKGNEKRIISSGTVALQGHDPKSKVLYKDVSIKLLP